ncbi:hypothetical protein GCM10012276_24870 [Nocardioides deserti]|nr:hypothetical protein GCM10012276_24870 [Nocardioides deserti]
MWRLRDVGSYREAAADCGTTHRAVERTVAAHPANGDGAVMPARRPRARNDDEVTDLSPARSRRSLAVKRR